MIIETKRLLMRALEPSDAPFLAGLINDPDVRGVLGAYNLIFPASVDTEQRWIDAAVKTTDVHLIPTKRSGGAPIGIISLKDINERNASAHLSIILERKSWDKGYGTEAITGLLGFMFTRMNIHRVWLRVSKDNKRAIGCYEKCGFEVEGTLREDHFAHGAWRDSYLMSVLSDNPRRKAR